MRMIGLDVGNGSTCEAVRIEDGRLGVKEFPSTFGVFERSKATKAIGSERNTMAPVDVYGFEGREYVLSYRQIVEAGSTPINTYGRENRVELPSYQLLTKLSLLDTATTLWTGSGAIEIGLALGVPNEDYRTSVLNPMRDWFKEPIVGTKNGKQVIVMVKRIEFLSQPLAVVVDALYDKNGVVVDAKLERENILVIDSGAGTLDLTELRGMKVQSKVSEAIGMNDVYKAIIDDIRDRDPKVRVDAYDLEFQLRSHAPGEALVYKYGATKIPIDEIYQQAKRDVGAAMIGYIERHFPDRTRFDRILLAGGTGDAFSDLFTAWHPQIVKSDKPQLAIARGLCKYVTAVAAAAEGEVEASSSEAGVEIE